MPDDATPPQPSTLSLVAGLLAQFLALPQEQVRVYAYKWDVPADSKVYVSVGFLAPERPYHTGSRTFDGEQDGQPALIEETTVSSQAVMTVDLYSFSDDALEYKNRLAAAFVSIYAQQLAEKWGLCFATLPGPINDLTAAESAANLFRFQTAVPVLRTSIRRQAVEYYDKNADGSPQLVLNQ